VLTGDFDGLLLRMAIRGRELIGDDESPGTCALAPVRTGIN
jgi:hypothetical protein